MVKTTKTPASTNEEAVAMGGSIDQIREILFGTAQREQDSRAVKLEKSLDQAAKRSSEQLDKTQRAIERRLDKLSTDFNARLDALTTRLGEAERTAKDDNAALENDLAGQIREGEESLREELRDLSDSIAQKLEELRADLGEATDRLETEKTGNETLGEYLLELGMRLKGDPTLSALKVSVGDGTAAKPDDDA